MIRVITISLMVVLFCTGCDTKAREEALQKREAELNERDQQLLLRETELAIKEMEIVQLQKQLDSVKTIRDTLQDTSQVYNQQLIGNWNVKMTCTETTCAGSAIGDTKSEIWDISYDNNVIVAKAMAGDKLVRVYTGSYNGSNLLLTESVAGAPAEPATKLTIRLTLSNNTAMEGQREIVRENDCRIVYRLQLSKQQPSTK